MNDVEAVVSGLSFDDLLQAVNESSRGRWFLDEYQKRMRKADNGDILSAINRIEARIGQMSVGAPTGELDRMKAAVNAARSDIAKLAQPKGLSDEGRLFAALADLARTALSAEKTTADIAPGIIKALQLVDELDTTLNGARKSDRYFNQDQALFEPAAPVMKPVLVTSTPEPVAAAKPIEVPKPVEAAKPVVKETASIEVPPQGAKLVIIKAGQKAVEPAKEEVVATPEVHETKAAEPVAAAPVVEVKKTEAALPVDKIDNPRIVIIRRKPEEMTEVPLADEPRAESAA